VNASAETLVGTGDDDQALLALAFHRLGLGRVEDGVGRLAVASGFRHCFLRSGELGRGHDLHGLGDLLDVPDRFQSALDLAEGSVVGGIGSDRAVRRAIRSCYSNITTRPEAEFVRSRVTAKTYRAETAAPARRAGRAALESML